MGLLALGTLQWFRWGSPMIRLSCTKICRNDRVAGYSRFLFSEKTKFWEWLIIAVLHLVMHCIGLFVATDSLIDLAAPAINRVRWQFLNHPLVLCRIIEVVQIRNRVHSGACLVSEVRLFSKRDSVVIGDLLPIVYFLLIRVRNKKGVVESFTQYSFCLLQGLRIVLTRVATNVFFCISRGVFAKVEQNRIDSGICFWSGLPQ